MTGDLDMTSKGDAGQATPNGSVHSDSRVAGGAAADTLTSEVRRETAAVTLMGSQAKSDAAPDAYGRPTFIFGSGNDSVFTSGRLDVLHVVGGQAGRSEPDRTFQIGVENVHLVDFASTVAAGLVTPHDTAERHDVSDPGDRARIDMVGIGPMTQSMLA